MVVNMGEQKEEKDTIHHVAPMKFCEPEDYESKGIELDSHF